MDGDRPLIPGASVRGPLRHAFSRAERAAGRSVQDPHLVQGNVGEDDPGGEAFGTVTKSSRILIRDARAEAGWAAAKLHMHAEDEFSAGSYGSAKRDAVRLLKGTFSVRIVVEGATPEKVEPLVALIDRQVALGALGHLPIGGHKTRGAGWGRWKANSWQIYDVKAERKWSPPGQLPTNAEQSSGEVREFFEAPETPDAHVRVQQGALGNGPLTLGEAAKLAKTQLDDKPLVAWWCDPAIDLALTSAPVTFGSHWPTTENTLHVDEVAFYAEDAVWRACRTATGARWVFIEEVSSGESGARKVKVMVVPARLHGFQRFSAATNSRGKVLLRQWYLGEQLLAFTIEKLEQEAS
jgi:CRISPR/Cas system CSM-associated protein Csm3 (group 7 of RAMP superfamily)